METPTQYLIDKKGKKQAVLLPVKEYDRLLEELEDLRDALELEERAESASSFIPYDVLRRRLKKQGRL